MSAELKRDWLTMAGLRAVILFVNNSHHCGYVAVPKGHILYGKDYDDVIPELQLLMSETRNLPIKNSPINVFLASGCAEVQQLQMRMAFRVHGGVTYARGELAETNDSDLWWIGFDCAHAGDKTKHSPSRYRDNVFRDIDYVATECESLANQISTLNCVKPETDRNSPRDGAFRRIENG